VQVPLGLFGAGIFSLLEEDIDTCVDCLASFDYEDDLNLFKVNLNYKIGSVRATNTIHHGKGIR